MKGPGSLLCSWGYCMYSPMYTYPFYRKGVTMCCFLISWISAGLTREQNPPGHPSMPQPQVFPIVSPIIPCEIMEDFCAKNWPFIDLSCSLDQDFARFHKSRYLPKLLIEILIVSWTFNSYWLSWQCHICHDKCLKKRIATISMIPPNSSCYKLVFWITSHCNCSPISGDAWDG